MGLVRMAILGGGRRETGGGQVNGWLRARVRLLQLLAQLAVTRFEPAAT
jgi:hypothetical protein